MDALNLLKDCPFCGGKAKADEGRQFSWVTCNECWITTPAHISVARAVDAWNRRHDETPSEFERLCGKENSHV